MSPAALKVVMQAKALLSECDAFLFVSSRNGNGRIGAHALTVAMRRFCETIKGDAGKSLRENPPSPHDLRRTFATQLAALGVPKEDREACLNHTRNDVGSKHYDLYDRADEKRAALNKFARQLEGVISAASK